MQMYVLCLDQTKNRKQRGIWGHKMSSRVFKIFTNVYNSNEEFYKCMTGDLNVYVKC